MLLMLPPGCFTPLLSFSAAAGASRRVGNRDDFLCLLDCAASGQTDNSGFCRKDTDHLRKVASNFVNVSAHKNNQTSAHKSCFSEAQARGPSAVSSDVIRTPGRGIFYTLPKNAKIRHHNHNRRLNHSQSSREELVNSQTKDLSIQGASKLTHTDAQGKARMVDVGGKHPTQREATASATVVLGPVAFRLLRDNQLVKGDALAVAQLAGIMAAKQTAALIPLCHPLSLDSTTVTFGLDDVQKTAVITARCQTTARTGVEMEALTAASVAALTLYDMCKAVSHDIIITDLKLLSKTGGKRDFHRCPPPPTPGQDG